MTVVEVTRQIVEVRLYTAVTDKIDLSAREDTYLQKSDDSCVCALVVVAIRMAWHQQRFLPHLLVEASISERL